MFTYQTTFANDVLSGDKQGKIPCDRSIRSTYSTRAKAQSRGTDVQWSFLELCFIVFIGINFCMYIYIQRRILIVTTYITLKHCWAELYSTALCVLSGFVHPCTVTLMAVQYSQNFVVVPHSKRWFVNIYMLGVEIYAVMNFCRAQNVNKWMSVLTDLLLTSFLISKINKTNTSSSFRALACTELPRWFNEGQIFKRQSMSLILALTGPTLEMWKTDFSSSPLFLIVCSNIIWFLFIQSIIHLLLNCLYS